MTGLHIFYFLLHEVNFVKQQPNWKVLLEYLREELKKPEKLRYCHLPELFRTVVSFFFSYIQELPISSFKPTVHFSM